MERRPCQATPSLLHSGDPLPPLAVNPTGLSSAVTPVKRNGQERSIGKCSPTSSLQDEGAYDCRGKEIWEQLGWARRC